MSSLHAIARASLAGAGRSGATMRSSTAATFAARTMMLQSSRTGYSSSMALARSSPSLQTYRHMHVRTLSFSSVPKAAFRAVRFPAYFMTAAGGAFAYANYKVDEFRGYMGDVLSRASEHAGDAFDSFAAFSTDAFSSAKNQWEAAREAARNGLDQVETPEFLRNAWSTLEAKAAELRDASAVKGNEMGSGQGSGGDKGPEGNPSPGEVGVSAGLVAAALTSDGDDEAASPDPQNTTEELMLLTRKLIEVRNILKSVDQDSDALTLPSIVVIGSQSSGKSSVLEAIVGHEFLPKGNNMVTRRPIELTLIHTTPPPKGTGRARDSVVEFAEFPGLGIGRVTDFAQIQKTLYDLNMAVPAEECVSDTPIELRIHSPHVPDLTLIDLPGYVQISGMDQPEELREKIATLCDRYIQEPNIILAVCSADVDLANSPALRASRKVDPLGLRTIGVVTKMDLVPPETGAAILSNNKYPLALGYIGVVCKKPSGIFKSSRGHDSATAEGAVTSATLREEDDFFTVNKDAFRAPTRGRNAGVEPLTGTDTLRRRLMSVLEESMGSSLHAIANAVQVELEEASYQFKVQYNDRSISAESYVAETMDALKLRFKDFATQFGKPEVRTLLKNALDEKVMDILAQMYWNDPRSPELPKLADNKKVTAEDLDRYWQYKLDASASALTKSGVGRLSTQLVVDAIRGQIEQLIRSEPFNYHPETTDRIVGFSTAILRDRFGLTADQVENCVKPFKYEVEVEPAEWEAGRTRSLQLVERELNMCEEAFNRIRSTIGKSRLSKAVEYVNALEERDRRRAVARAKARTDGAEAAVTAVAEQDDDPTRPDYNQALLARAREAKFLANRADMLKLRAAALKSKRCKLGPESKAFCPEAFLNVVADKLTYTAVMFINIELLSEFFYQFPREIDSRLVYDLDKAELARFARENPGVRAHLDLQERKEKLELVMDKLDSLVKLYQEKNAQAPRRESGASKWGFF